MITAADPVPPHLLLATLRGFWQPEHASLLHDYVFRYFAEMPSVAARRGSPMVDRVLADLGFPSYAAAPDVVPLAESLLEAKSITPGLARYVADRLDETRRALRARGAA